MDGANAATAASQKHSSLGQRVISALVLLPLVIALVWWSVWSLVATVAAVAVIGVVELYNAFAQSGYHPRITIGITITLALVAAVALQPLAPFDLLPLALGLSIIGSLIAELPHYDHKGALSDWALMLSGALYVGGLLGYLVLIRSLATPLKPGLLTPLGLSSGAAWIYFVLAITWLQDAFAYFIGKRLGRHKMAPGLSPKKTWEGAAGGMIGAIIAGVAATFILGLPISPLAGAALGAVGGIVGPLGDLAESMIKRQVGLKDAGNIIPGHGGLLDRVDSLMFTAPALFYLILLLVGRSA